MWSVEVVRELYSCAVKFKQVVTKTNTEKHDKNANVLMIEGGEQYKATKEEAENKCTIYI